MALQTPEGLRIGVRWSVGAPQAARGTWPTYQGSPALPALVVAFYSLISRVAQTSLFDLCGSQEACRLAVRCDTYSHMKTTVEISNSLLEQAKRLASQERTTVRALMEEGLRRVIAERKATEPFKLRKVTFRGKGLQPEMAGASWQQIRDTAYEGRGA